MSHHDKSIGILEEYELEHPIEYSTSSGLSYRFTVEEILFQIINHSTYHRGQIATEFRMLGIEPLRTDYIYYKMMKQF